MTLSAVVCCLLLGLVAEIIGLSLYNIAVTNQYIRHAYTISRNTAMVMDIPDLTNKVMTIYRGMSEEERAMTGTEEYKERFSEITNQSYVSKLLSESVKNNADTGEGFDVYIAAIDIENNAIVYILDTGDSDYMSSGEWDSIDISELNVLDWHGENILYITSYTTEYGWLYTTGIPVKDERDEVCAYVFVDVPLSCINDELISFAVRTGLGILAVTLLIAVFHVLSNRRSVVRPINEIAAAAAGYVQDKKENAAVTDHFSKLKINTGDEIEHLAGVMSEMDNDIAIYEDNITKITAEKERISAELGLASRIQLSALPTVFPAFPERS